MTLIFFAKGDKEVIMDINQAHPSQTVYQILGADNTDRLLINLKKDSHVRIYQC
jgi:hypothetical protein